MKIITHTTEQKTQFLYALKIWFHGGIMEGLWKLHGGIMRDSWRNYIMPFTKIAIQLWFI
jgi:hypothetical protein